jgi:undecaprenyl-diphosphatase
MDALYGIDLWFLHLGNQVLANPVGDVLFPFLTEVRYFYIPYAVALLAVMIFFRKRGIIAVLLLVVTIGASDQLSSTVIKKTVGRPRPCHDLALDRVVTVFDPSETKAGPVDTRAPQIRLLVNCGSGRSFPSSHAVNNFAAAMLFALFFPRARIWLFVFATLVAYSRVYVGVHYPSDILAGAAIGAGLAWIIVRSAVRLIPAVRSVIPPSPAPPETSA